MAIIVLITQIKGILPDDMKHKVDYNSLKLSPDTYVSKQLKKTFTDVVYDGIYGIENKAKIAFIIEHKSYNPKQNVKLQLLQYFLSVTLIQIDQVIEPQAVPVMILLYHGEHKLKNEPLHKVFGENLSEELIQKIPDFDIIISDFTTYDNEKLKHYSIR